MMKKQREIDTKLIVDVEIDGVDMRDYPKLVDAYVSKAMWKDTDRQLSEEELEDLNDNHYEFVFEEVMESLRG